MSQNALPYRLDFHTSPLAGDGRLPLVSAGRFHDNRRSRAL